MWSPFLYLLLSLQLIASSLSQDQPYVCNRRWNKVLEHDTAGIVTEGSKVDLTSALSRGAQLRFHVRQWGGNNGYTADIHNAQIVDGNVCAQSLLHISKSSWEGFQPDAYWWFVLICTTGHVHMSRWMVGDHTLRSETKSTVAVTWFTRELGCTEGDDASIYSHSASGSSLSGSLHNLLHGLSSGFEIRAVEPSGGYAFPLQNMAWDAGKAAGQSIWHVSQTKVGGNHNEFQANAYWWFTMWSTSGKNDMSRWNVGSTTSRGHTDRSVSLKWIVDPCWILAYEHDNQGNPIDGSLGYLREAVLKGHRVRAVMGNYSIEADMLSVRNGHVNAQLLGHISKQTIETFQTNVYWYWEIISTTGSFKTYRYRVGNNTHVSDSFGQRSVAWYVDTRHWKHVLSHTSTGTVTRGSKTNLATAAQNGAMVRYALRFPGQTSVAILQADNIGINGDDIGAQSIRSVSQSNVGSEETALQSEPYWWFTITTTTGSVAMSRWTVGLHTSRGNGGGTSAVDWFVNE